MYHYQKPDATTGEGSTLSSEPTPSAPAFPPARSNAGMLVTLGIVSAFLSLFIIPEIFGSAAIILGAYTWKKEEGKRGLYIVILGIVFMLVGIYFTSQFALIDLLPPSSSTALHIELI